MANENVSIKDLSALIKTKNAGWLPAETSMFRLPDEERKKRLGAKSPAGKASLRERENIAAANMQQAKLAVG